MKPGHLFTHPSLGDMVVIRDSIIDPRYVIVRKVSGGNPLPIKKSQVLACDSSD